MANLETSISMGFTLYFTADLLANKKNGGKTAKEWCELKIS